MDDEAILDASVWIDELAAVLGDGSGEAVASAALASGLVVEDGAELRFDDPLIRDAVLRQMPAAVRVALHRRAAVVLTGLGAWIDTVAAHLLAVGDDTDEWALDWLAKTWTRAGAIGAPDTAAELFRTRFGAAWPMILGGSWTSRCSAVGLLRADNENVERLARQVLSHARDGVTIGGDLDVVLQSDSPRPDLSGTRRDVIREGARR